MRIVYACQQPIRLDRDTSAGESPASLWHADYEPLEVAHCGCKASRLKRGQPAGFQRHGLVDLAQALPKAGFLEKIIFVASAAGGRSPLGGDAIRAFVEDTLSGLDPQVYPGLTLQVEDPRRTSSFEVIVRSETVAHWR